MTRELVRRFVETDVTCLHCGRTVGTLCREDGVIGAATVFQSRQGGSTMILKSLVGLRCSLCHGPVQADAGEITYRYPIEALAAERPRRGRPPKRLLEERRRQEQLTA
jgi:hypothetical protein